jgi:hypothetical protein
VGAESKQGKREMELGESLKSKEKGKEGKMFFLKKKITV